MREKKRKIDRERERERERERDGRKGSWESALALSSELTSISMPPCPSRPGSVPARSINCVVVVLNLGEIETSPQRLRLRQASQAGGQARQTHTHTHTNTHTHIHRHHKDTTQTS